MSQTLSQPEMLLVAFCHVSGGTTNKVPYEELVLQAWRDFPEAFSLRNHPEFPDASDIHKKLYQELKSAGLVIPLGNKVFRLTDKGLERAAILTATLEGAPVAQGHEKVRLARSEKNFMEHALRSRAFATWSAGHQEDLVDYDARMFFQFSTGTPIQERKRRVEFAKEAIQKACRVGAAGAPDLERLTEFLVEKFDKLLEEV